MVSDTARGGGIDRVTIEACERRFGIDLSGAAPGDLQELIDAVRHAIAHTVASGGDARFALAAARELAGADVDPATPLSTVWPRAGTRRRAWRRVRAHLALPRLTLGDRTRLALMLPSLAGLIALTVAMRPDVSGAIYTASPLVLINLMANGLIERAFGTRLPRGFATVADLARALRANPHDHPWDSASIAHDVLAIAASTTATARATGPAPTAGNARDDAAQ